MYKELSTPAVVVDLEIVERNISRMAERLRAPTAYQDDQIRLFRQQAAGSRRIRHYGSQIGRGGNIRRSRNR